MEDSDVVLSAVGGQICPVKLTQGRCNFGSLHKLRFFSEKIYFPTSQQGLPINILCNIILKIKNK